MLKYLNTEFKREKYSSLSGMTTVRLEQITGHPYPFKICCDSAGINFDGILCIESQSELQDFARLIGDAWKEHLLLAPKIYAPDGFDVSAQT